MKEKKEELIKELFEIIDRINDSLVHVKNGKQHYCRPLAVELRKLYLGGQGNNLLKRIQKLISVELKFQVRTQPVIPPTFKTASIDEYLNEFRFFYSPNEYNRAEIISLIADEKGAHLDDKPDGIHSVSENVILYDLTQLNYYLVEIGETTVLICQNQIFNKD